MKNRYQNHKRNSILTTLLLGFILLFSLPVFLSAQVIVPFSQRTSVYTPTKTVYNIKGDFALMGNTNLTLVNYGDNTSNNNSMAYVDIDGNNSTVNSSSSTLQLSTENGAIPSCSNIIFAGLYWTGRAQDGGTSPDTFLVTKNGTSVMLNKQKVLLKGPSASSYTSITASPSNIYYPNSTDGQMYSAYAEVTDYVRQHGLGEYFVANLALKEGNGGGTGYYGGWAMIVVYENSKMNWRDVTIFDGHAYVAGSTTIDYTLPVSGFNTIQNGNVNMKLGLIAGEGDRGISGDYFQIRDHSNTNWVALNHTGNITNNFFNSSIYTGGNSRNPNLVNNTGLDISMFSIPNAGNSVVKNNQTSATFRYGSTQDTYIIFMMAMAVDAYIPTPESQNIVQSINNTTYVSGNPLVALPGNEIELKMDIRNKGTEPIDSAVLIIPIPFATSYISSSRQVFYTPAPTPNNQYFDPTLGANGSIVWKIGTLPLPSNPNDLLGTLTYRIKVTEDCAILANSNCASQINIYGSMNGIGQISHIPVSNHASIQGFVQTGSCVGEAITAPISISINATNYVQSHCGSAPALINLTFCNLSSNIPISQVSGNFPAGCRFYNQYPVTPSTTEYTTSNPFPATIGTTTYYAIPVGTTSCYFVFTIEVLNISSTPSVNASPVNYCIGFTANPLTATPSNPSFTLYYYSSLTGLPQVSITPSTSMVGTTTYYVAEGISGSCISPNKVPITVTVTPLPVAPISASVNQSTLCFGSSENIILTANGGSGSTLNWYSGNCGGTFVGTGNNLSISAPTTTTTYYASWSSDCGTSSCAQVTIAVSPQLVASATVSSQVSCNNGNDGSITVTATGGTGTYNYSLNGGTPQSSNIFTGLVAGSYSVVVLDANNCSATTSTVVISNPLQLVASATGSSQVSCFNGNDGSITATAMGGTGTYSYSLNGGEPQSSNVFTGLTSGSYSVVVLDANNCSATTSTVVISNPLQLVASATGSSQVSCSNGNDGSITVTATGGTGTYSYSLNGGTPQSSNIFTGLVAGSYSVAVQDDNNCSATTSTVVISNPLQLVASAIGSLQVSCFNGNDGSITVTATGGTGTYSYSLNGGASQSSNVFTGLTSGSYSVAVLDANNCSVTTSTVVISNPDPLVASATVSSQVSCFNGNDGSITVTATGGTGTYSYSLNGGASQSSNVLTGLTSGSYSVVVLDANNCSATTSTVVISNPLQLVASATGSSQVSCFNGNDGSITVTATGGTGTYSYSLNGGASQSSNVLTGLTSGSYSVAVLDANNCSATAATVVISNPSKLVASAAGTTQVSCFNGNDGSITATATGGTGTYSYSLNGGEPQSSNVFTGLTSGSYSVVVLDANNCSATTSTVVISNPLQLVASATGSSQVSCSNGNDGSITVTATGGAGTYNYSLNGDAPQSSNIFTGLLAGSYSVAVLDANNCSATTSTVVISNPLQLMASATGSSQVSCFNGNDGSITVTATGGTGTYSYSLNGDAFQSSNVFNGLTSGSYSVEVQDANNCSATTAIVVISNPDPLVASATVSSQVSCNNGNDGSITVTATGGTGTYSYSLNGGEPQSSNVFTNVSAGNYQIKVIDAMGCFVNLEVKIDQPVPLTLTYSAYCRGGIPGVIITAMGGISPYQYSIDGGATYSLDNKFDTTIIGTHIYLVVKDVKGCISEAKEVEVKSLNTLSASVNVISNNLCSGVNDASAEVIITGGFAPYTISINMGQPSNNQYFTNLASGEYQVLVRDSNTCPALATFDIKAKDPIAVDLLSKSDIDCSGSNGGSAQLSVNGGEAPYSYQWSNGNNEATSTNLTYGINTVTITDANNCVSTYQVMISLSQPSNELEFQNVFSPNNDGINDYWVIKNLEYFPENELVIINRWGNEVYTKKSYKNDWDGTQLTEGTYFYVLNVQMCSETKKFSGYITIVR